MLSTSVDRAIGETIDKGRVMDRGDSQKDEKNEADGRKDLKMLSTEQVEELLHRDAKLRGEQVKKSPEELRQWFDRMIEQLEQEGLDGPSPREEPWMSEIDERLSK